MSCSALKAFHTKYKLTDDVEYSLNRGLTFKRDMLPLNKKLEEISMCLRIQIDYFTMLGDYTVLLDIWNEWEEDDVLNERNLYLRVR